MTPPQLIISSEEEATTPADNEAQSVPKQETEQEKKPEIPEVCLKFCWNTVALRIAIGSGSYFTYLNTHIMFESYIVMEDMVAYCTFWHNIDSLYTTLKCILYSSHAICYE